MLAWIITSGITVASVLLIRHIFKGKIGLRLQYALWLLVLVRLLTPVNLIDSDISILNLIPQAQETGGFWIPGDGTLAASGSPGQNLTQGERPEGAQPLPQGQQSAGQGEGQRNGVLPYTPANRDGGAQETDLWRTVLTGIWLVGMAVTGTVIVGVNLSFSHRLRRARKAVGPEEMDAYGTGRRLPVYRVSGLPSPCLFGVIHPAIYLPEDVTREQFPYVLAHEESHYRMGDHIWSLLRSLCLALHWYHPLVWLAAWVSRQDSELACDERTVCRLGEECRSAYGRVLVEVTAERGRRTDFLCCATAMNADGNDLRERVQMIARRPRTLAATGVILAVLLLGIFCVACTGVREEGDAADTPSEETRTPRESGESREPQPGQQADGSGTEEDVTDPTVDHVRSDNAYYRIIKDTTIDDPYFTMEVPQSFVDKAAYGVLLGQSEGGERYLLQLTLFHVDSVPQILEGEPQYGWHDLTEGGCLGYCFWTGYPDLEPDLEEIVYRSGTWDIRGMEYLLAQEYDWLAGVGGSLIQANRAGTGAYFYAEPTDVQYDPQDTQAAQEYLTCLKELRTCWDSFAPARFPYEELEGYPTEDIPRWRQDFEKAEEIYSWFTTMGEIPMGEEHREPVAGDALFRVVEVPGVHSVEDLRDLVNRYFAPEITDALLAGSRPTLDDKGYSPLFVEIDGELLAMSGGVGLYQRTDAERQYVTFFEENAEGRRTARINMWCQSSWNLMSDDFLPTAVLTYTMEEQEDGSWRIVGDYELPISLTLAQSYGEDSP